MSDTAAAAATGPRATGQSQSAELPPFSGVMAGVMDRRALPPPVVVKRGDARIDRILGKPQVDDAKDVPQKRDMRIARRAAVDELLREILGPVVRDVTRLQRCDGRVLEEHRDLDGRIARWSLWAPKAGIIIDRPKTMPNDEELGRRMAYAQRNGIRYAVVSPGAKVSPSEIRNWVEEIKEEATNG